MASLQSLRLEHANTAAELTELRLQLDRARVADVPDRPEQRRLHGLADEARQSLALIQTDIKFELERHAGAAQVEARAKARQARDRAVAAVEGPIADGWLQIEKQLRGATKIAAALTAAANPAAGDATGAAWAHYIGRHGASEAAGAAVTATLGGARHAHALACLLRELIAALPASIAPRLATQYGVDLASCHGPITTMGEATERASLDLRQQTSAWLLEEVA